MRGEDQSRWCSLNFRTQPIRLSWHVTENHANSCVEEWRDRASYNTNVLGMINMFNKIADYMRVWHPSSSLRSCLPFLLFLRVLFFRSASKKTGKAYYWIGDVFENYFRSNNTFARYTPLFIWFCVLLSYLIGRHALVQIHWERKPFNLDRHTRLLSTLVFFSLVITTPDSPPCDVSTRVTSFCSRHGHEFVMLTTLARRSWWLWLGCSDASFSLLLKSMMSSAVRSVVFVHLRIGQDVYDIVRTLYGRTQKFST